MAEAKDEKSTIPAATRERLTKERDAFWARKVCFAVAMKVALHTMKSEEAKDSALMILGRDVILDFKEHYGSEDISKRIFDFTNDCKQLIEELASEYHKQFGDQ